MNLTLDIGNTRTKAAVFDAQEMKAFVEDVTQEQWMNLAGEHDVSSVIVSNVGNQKVDLGNLHGIILNYETALPIELDYNTPETLGADRIAVAVGGHTIFPKNNVLVIDIGTCITYDLIEASGVYRGGAISPGPRIKSKAMNTYTAQLPVVDWKEAEQSIGKDTKTSLQSGLLYGTLAEIEGMINQYQETYPELKVVLCGGDAKFFESKLKGGIFVLPQLIHIGLNRILNFNVKGN